MIGRVKKQGAAYKRGRGKFVNQSSGRGRGGIMSTDEIRTTPEYQSQKFTDSMRRPTLNLPMVIRGYFVIRIYSFVI
jgi:hypothetical protein